MMADIAPENKSPAQVFVRLLLMLLHVFIVNRTPECTENGKENVQKTVTGMHRKW